ncbi:MAG: KEOPS complex subunit Pcc1 [Candidatus Hadarchaeota archaeon]|nr:KEOPS complex subunit Pcc1 [Candidatus Hadarchaeota archaeon]
MVKAERTSASIELTFPSGRAADVVCSSLKPEELLPKSTRCKASVSCRKNVLCLEIDARDTAALRAALNSFLRWMAVARDMVEVGRD